MAEADLDDEDEDEARGPVAPPNVFGFEAAPLGCGINAAFAFAILIGPAFIFQFMPTRETPGVPAGALVVLALVAGLFGLATAGVVRGRVRAMAAGAPNRPPLWAVFIALLILAIPLGTILAMLLVILLEKLGGL
jgi:hypothetical protein